MKTCRTLPRWMLVCTSLLLAACATLRTDFVRQPSSALAPAADTATARYVRAELAGHDGESGFRLLTLSTNALMSRIKLADHAQHSIDLQYYIYADDATGRLVAQRLLAAADRGVRVRLLLDHIKVEKQIGLLEAMDAHPNIEVRFFNPFLTRRPSLPSKVAQLLLSGPRLNRRMHNKSFVVDNLVAVIGGRNIGDDYFDANSDLRYRDLDLIAIGAVVDAASRSFDAYWNGDAAYPLAAFRRRAVPPPDLQQLRTKLADSARRFSESDYAQTVLEELPQGPSADRFGEWFWGPATLVADQPEKVDPKRSRRALEVGPQVKAMMQTAQEELLLISPYFIPGRNGTRLLAAQSQRGVAVKVLTNSLAATDEPLVHAAYVHYRHRLLESGVSLYELRPAPDGHQEATAHGASSGVSLHAKALVVDHRRVLIGSMNLDPRSRLLNTEMGLVVDSPPLATAVAQFFATATQPANAWAVTRTDGGKLRWNAADDGAATHSDVEPGASPKRRLQVMFMRLLPIDNLL